MTFPYLLSILQPGYSTGDPYIQEMMYHEFHYLYLVFLAIELKRKPRSPVEKSAVTREGPGGQV